MSAPQGRWRCSGTARMQINITGRERGGGGEGGGEVNRQVWGKEKLHDSDSGSAGGGRVAADIMRER